MRSQAGVFLKPAHQSCPSGQGEQFGLKNCFPVSLAKMQRIEVVQNGISRREGKVLLPLQLFVQSDEVARKNSAASCEKRPNALIKTLLAVRHGPISHALVQKHRTQPDQPRMND